MIKKIFINLLALIIISVIQIGFIKSLPDFWSSFNLVLVVLIFILEAKGLIASLWWGLGVSVFYDLYFFYPYGFSAIVIEMTLLAAYALLVNFFTNRSLYSFLALVFFATIFSKFFSYFLASILNLMNIQTVFLEKVDALFFKQGGQELILNLMAIIILFYVMNFLGNTFKPVFLEDFRKRH